MCQIFVFENKCTKTRKVYGIFLCTDYTNYYNRSEEGKGKYKMNNTEEITEIEQKKTEFFN